MKSHEKSPPVTEKFSYKFMFTHTSIGLPGNSLNKVTRSYTEDTAFKKICCVKLVTALFSHPGRCSFVRLRPTAHEKINLNYIVGSFTDRGSNKILATQCTGCPNKNGSPPFIRNRL